MTVLKVTALDGRVLQTIDVGSTLHSVTETPEKYGSMVDDGFGSKYHNYQTNEQNSFTCMKLPCWELTDKIVVYDEHNIVFRSLVIIG